jgi:large subunit ribosomal protein L18
MKTQKKRKLERKTDYRKRLGLLKSEKPRLIFRKTNKYILSQYVTSEEAKDRVIFGITSKELLKFGWPKEFEGSLKSISASYLIGYLTGKKIKEKKLEKPILDLGMYRIIEKSRAFAFIKGLIDAEIKIQCKEDKLPNKDVIEGKNLKEDFSEYFKKVKLKIDGK